MKTTSLKRLYSARAIKRVVTRLAKEIERDHCGKSIIIVALLKGSFLFTADLIRAIKLPVSVDFIQASSYGKNTTSGKLRISKDLNLPIYKQHVILVDDIVDTGRTTEAALRHLRSRKPASLRLCTLLDKPSKRMVPIKIDYLGFTIPDIFVVGYGIDYAEQYRQLPEIYGITDLKD